uniref:CCHC-type domain-containing protein n=1 Tax=Ananas comosus var. bracteatus TaxID=296719 RepID=A0A6V7PS72_ANACO|nr:unnamed protein product [Ananas comosus var. bracteatus]
MVRGRPPRLGCGSGRANAEASSVAHGIRRRGGHWGYAGDLTPVTGDPRSTSATGVLPNTTTSTVSAEGVDSLAVELACVGGSLAEFKIYNSSEPSNERVDFVQKGSSSENAFGKRPHSNVEGGSSSNTKPPKYPRTQASTMSVYASLLPDVERCKIYDGKHLATRCSHHHNHCFRCGQAGHKQENCPQGSTVARTTALSLAILYLNPQPQPATKNEFIVKQHRVGLGHRIRLTPAKEYEKNYTTHELELAAVVFAHKLWRHYLYGAHCKDRLAEEFRRLEIEVVPTGATTQLMTVVVQPTLIERILLGQQSDPYLQKVWAEIEQGKDRDFSIHTNGSLRFRGR